MGIYKYQAEIDALIQQGLKMPEGCKAKRFERIQIRFQYRYVQKLHPQLHHEASMCYYEWPKKS